MVRRVLDQVLTAASRAEPEALDLAKALVGLDTTNTGAPDSGQETQVANFLGDLLKGEGIKEFQLLGRTLARQNLVASLPGRSRHCHLLWLSHSDVVPAGNLADWVTPPFSARVRGGRLYGRGTADMKGILAAQVVALLIARRLHLDLAGSVRLVCAADEEAGGRYGAGWLRQHHPALLRARLAINEGGGRRHTVDGRYFYGVAVGEKGRYEATIEFSGTSAHASTPWRGANAISRAAEFVRRVTSEPPTSVTQTSWLEPLQRLTGPLPEDPVDLETMLTTLAARQEPLATDVRALTRTTVTPTIIHGGSKSNVVADQARVVCDVRTLPGHTRLYVLHYLRHHAAGLSATVRLATTATSPVSTPRPDVIPAIRQALQAAMGKDIEIYPTLTLGFTDSRFAREVGTPALGFAPDSPDGEGGRERMHGSNESLRIDDLYLRVRFFAASLAFFAGSKQA